MWIPTRLWSNNSCYSLIEQDQIGARTFKPWKRQRKNPCRGCRQCFALCDIETTGYFSAAKSFPCPPSILLLVPVGFSKMLQMSSSNTLIQTMVPDELRGRVMAVYSMMFMGMAPFGALVAGTMANRIGAPTTVALGGLTCLAGSLVFGARWPNLRGEAHQLIVAQGMLSGEPPAEMSSQAVSMGKR